MPLRPPTDETSQRNPSLDVVLVDWNTGDLAADCVTTILSSEASGLDLGRIVVVDNGSARPTRLFLGSQPERVECVRNERNVGFGRACNQGGSGSQADYLLFLNADVRLRRETLSRTVHWLEQAKQGRTGVCGVRLIGSDNEIQRSCSRLPSAASLLASVLGLDQLFGTRFDSSVDYASPSGVAVEQVMGAFFLVRRELFVELGGFDERFFLYYEEVDLCWRARERGWSTAFFGGAEADHAGQASSRQVQDWRIYWHQSSRLTFARKHFGKTTSALLLAGVLLVEPWVRTAQGLLRASMGTVANAWKANWRLWQALPKILSHQEPRPQKGEPVRVARVQSRMVVGGPAKHTLALARGMSDRRFRTLLITGRHEPHEKQLIHAAADNGLETRVLNRMSRAVRPRADLKSFLELWRIFREFRPHVVHTHTAKAGALGRTAAWLAGVPVVYHTFHGHVFEGYFGPTGSRLVVYVERILSRLTTRTLVISESQRHDLIDRFRVATEDRVRLVPLGLDWASFFDGAAPPGGLRKRFGIPGDRTLVASIGRIVPIKNLDLMIDIAQLLIDRFPGRFHFLVAGDGEDRPGLERRIESLGLSDAFVFPGWIEVNHSVYREIDLVLCTSDNEGTPVALIEAIAAGTAVVSRAVGGVDDLLANVKLPRAVDSTAPEDFLRPIEQALTDPTGRMAASQRARDVYDARRLVSSVQRLYVEDLGLGPEFAPPPEEAKDRASC